MLTYTNEHDFYMEYENDFLNCESFGILVFVSNHSNECQVVLNCLESWTEDNEISAFGFEMDENPVLCEDLNIIDAPTVLFYVDGELHTRFENGIDPTDMIAQITNIMKGEKSDNAEE